LKLNSDDSEFVYRQVLIEALGRIGDERAIEPILKAWEKDESLTTVARQALFELTGNIADTPADFRKLNKR
ncbi:MAG: hypothetical protein L6Q71_10675, partial [Planctomycetes bacterium]|nr:hypothetical protein [Planctomycetota bacterium]